MYWELISFLGGYALCKYFNREKELDSYDWQAVDSDLRSSLKYLDKMQNQDYEFVDDDEGYIRMLRDNLKRVLDRVSGVR